MYSAIRQNKINTFIIMMLFVVIIGVMGYLVGIYVNNMTVPLVTVGVALIYALIQYFVASRLAISMAGGREITKRDNPTLWNTVENLAITAGMPMPRVFIIDDPAPNAFATGRDPKHAYVAATTGLLDIMTKRELEAVMAHEMSHVKNYDIRVSMIVFGITSAIGLLADIMMHISYFASSDDDDSPNIFAWVALIVTAILAPIVSTIVQLAVSRQREYLADSSGALLTRDPEGLASALDKLRSHSQPMRRQNGSTAHLYINNPLKKGFLNNLFSTHPPLDDRIKRLMGMRDKM